MSFGSKIKNDITTQIVNYLFDFIAVIDEPASGRKGKFGVHTCTYAHVCARTHRG